ncbi:glycosyltransferase family 4 protein [Janibacter sp. GXQ6167]|uniref:glycosyltransferase family 4 protein n=1 Tax=Janibacter sp. GXQ6167 TaxID=3240791 RepID=UPI0035236A66
MRVAMVLGRSTGGIGVHVRDLVAELTALGDEVIVLTDDLTQERFRYPAGRTGWPDRRRPLRALTQARSWRSTLRAADIVHAHGFQAGIVAATLLAGRRRPPLVVSLHNQIPTHGQLARVGHRAAQWLASRTALMTGASSDLVDLATTLGARATALAPVPSPRVAGLLALDREPWRAQHRADLLISTGLDPDLPLVVSICRIAPQKRLPDLLTATAHGPAKAQWVVIGDGDHGLRNELQARIDDEQLPVSLLGAVDDPTAWLLAADVFVLTSTWEARALVIQEAMAAGTAVVATRTGGLPDLLDGVGALVPVGEPARFGRAAADSLNNSQAVALAERARARAARWATPRETAEAWQRWYADLA